MIYALDTGDKLLHSTRKMDVVYEHQKYRRKHRARYLELTERKFNSITKQKVEL